jgi:hypothetical protein
MNAAVIVRNTRHATPIATGTYVQVTVPTDDLDLGADFDVWYGHVTGTTGDGRQHWIADASDPDGDEYLVQVAYVAVADDRVR